MPDSSSPAPPDAELLLQELRQIREAVAATGFGNPVLSLARRIEARLDHDAADRSAAGPGALATGAALDEAALAALVRTLRDEAFRDRAARTGRYVGSTDRAASHDALEAIAASALGGAEAAEDFDAARVRIERTRFSAVFTAHPTFAHPPAVYADLAAIASGREAAADHASHRPERPTLEDEFTQAVAAINHGRNAIDALSQALLRAARHRWPDRWSTLRPRPVTLASWVGYDTDGRVDIGWWDTLRLRLRMKRLGLERLRDALASLPAPEASRRVEAALAAVSQQIEACPTEGSPEAVAHFGRLLRDTRDTALRTPEPLLRDLDAAVEAAEGEAKLALSVARAGLFAHGLSLAHTHVRLNAAQLHNAVRQRTGLADPPADPSRRRSLLAAMEEALDALAPVPVDFGALLAEQASAARLMMTVAQVVKHVDGTSPVRFLIAETESGYTLLSALYLAKLFGVERQVEISPLFETPEALENGERVLEEALRSPHWRRYLSETGRLSLQFGYSDSGRYMGQLPATYLIERLRLRVAELLSRHGLSGVEVVFFDTHGESVGRGAHPFSLRDRLRYLSPTRSRRVLVQAGIPVRLESAFQGGDGYVLFGTPELALATVARIAEHSFATIPPQANPSAGGPDGIDPVYAEGDFTAGFFTTAGAAMRELVEDPGYAALLGAFGPALLDPTGSRPSARQSDSSGGPAVIRHPRELRAIPNNAILQQVGWMANTLHGLGQALSRYGEDFTPLRERSPRFHRALDFAAHALAHSDLDVLRAVVSLLDPGAWLDRAADDAGEDRAAALRLATILEELGLAAPMAAMFRRVQADHVLLRATWTDAPRMEEREVLLHALRLAIIGRIWRLAMRVPEFSPRHGVTHAALLVRLVRLDVPAALDLLSEIFPVAPDPAAGLDYGEEPGPRGAASYAREHAEVFAPMGRLFALLREVTAAVSHETGAFG